MVHSVRSLREGEICRRREDCFEEEKPDLSPGLLVSYLCGLDLLGLGSPANLPEPRIPASAPRGRFVTYLGPATVMDLLEIRPAEADPEDKIIGLTGNAIGLRIRAAALTSDLGDGFSGHSCRVGMAIDLARQGATIPEIMQVGRWKSAVMVARYIRAEEAATGAVARYERQP